MLIGWSKKDLTWNENLMLAGHHSPRQAQAVLDNLFATAVLLNDTVICSVDFLNVPEDLVNGIQSDKHVVFIATHNHSGYDWDLASEAYKTFAITQCQAAIDECIQNAAEGEIAWGIEPLSIACQKRIVYANENGADEPGMKYVDKSKASFSYYDGGVDETLSCVFTFVNNELNGILMNVPCPAQCSEWLPKVSADYWTQVRNEVADNFGNDVYVLPMCGPAGEVTPELLRYGKAEERKAKLMFNVEFDSEEAERDHNSQSYENRAICSRRIIAGQILAAVNKMYNWCANERTSENLIYRAKEFSIGADDYEEAMGWTIDDYYTQSKKAQMEINKGTYEIPAEFETLDVEVVTLANTKVGFVFSGFELYTNYGLRIQQLCGKTLAIVSQLAGIKGTGYLADNLDNVLYEDKKAKILGPVGAHVYCLTAGRCLVQTRNCNPNDFDTLPQYENSVLNNVPVLVRTVNDGFYHIRTEEKGEYTITSLAKKNAPWIYCMYEQNSLNPDDVYITLQPGTYRIYGCQVRLINSNGEERLYHGLKSDLYEPAWTEFTVNEATVVDRVALYLRANATYNDYTIAPKFEKVVIE